MRRVKISELKVHLSQYLRAAEAGETIVVCKRGREIAQLTPTVGAGLRLRPPVSKTDLRAIKAVPPRYPVDVVDLLRQDRGDR
ncbi:MAG: type II toxin-antitoxin system prevent-host-death family antitoxin [Dehalococcoidia bacterium]